MLKALDVHRAEYRQDPAKLRALVDQVLLPHFDTEFAARLVLSRHWDMATTRASASASLPRSTPQGLLGPTTMATALLVDFTADRQCRYLPYRGAANAPNAAIATRVRKNDGSVVSINYQLRHTDQGWKVWDVVVEGISYDKSFQEDFAEQITHQGLDAVISRLEHGETPAAIKRHTTGS